MSSAAEHTTAHATDAEAGNSEIPPDSNADSVPVAAGNDVAAVTLEPPGATDAAVTADNDSAPADSSGEADDAPPVPLFREGLPVGEPIAFRVLDADGTLLLDAGSVIPLEEDVDFLFEHFTPHRDRRTLPLAEESVRLPLRDPVKGIGEMSLSVGARLGIRLPLGGVKTTHASRLIGYAPNESIFVTPPMAESGRLEVHVGEVVEVVAVSSRAVYLFMCTVDSVQQRPFPYVILSRPGLTRRVRERRTERIKLRLAVLFTTTERDGEAISGLGLANDISDLGMALATAREIGTVGDRIHIVFYLDMDETTVAIDTWCHIRNVKSLKPTSSGEFMFEYGVEYELLQPDPRFALRSYVLSHRR